MPLKHIVRNWSWTKRVALVRGSQSKVLDADCPCCCQILGSNMLQILAPHHEVSHFVHSSVYLISTHIWLELRFLMSLYTGLLQGCVTHT
jgi:hypothetical protein